MKVTIIKEANDIATMKVDKLFGSLRTFKLNLRDSNSKKRNGVALQSVSEDDPEQHKEQIHDDHLADSITLLMKQVSKLRSQFNKQFGNYGSQNNKDFGSSSSSSFETYVPINEGRMTKVTETLEPTEVTAVLNVVSVKDLGTMK